MKKLVMPMFLAALLVQTTGCIFTTAEDEGRFRVQWSVTVNGADSTCANAGAEFVHVTIIDFDGPYQTDVYPCGDGLAETRDVPLGIYDVEVTLVGAGAEILSGPVTFTNRELIDDGEVQSLENVVWALTGGGVNVAFTTDFGDTGGANCASIGSGGEEVERIEISFVLISSMACEVYDFVAITPGGDKVGMTCETGIDCVETNVVTTLEGVLDGEYTMTISGFRDIAGNDTECFAGEITAVVDGADVNLDVLEIPSTNLAGC